MSRFLIVQTLIVIFCFSTHARQVVGRPTLPSDCGQNETWVTSHDKNKGHWTAHCRNIGSEKSSLGYRYLSKRLKSGKPPSWPFKEIASSWEVKDIADVLWAIDRIPEQLWNPDVEGIYRMKKSESPENPGTDHNGSIVLYDPAFQSEFFVERVLSHELAHEKFRSMDKAQRGSYAIAAGWKIIKDPDGPIYHPPKCCFVRPVGEHSLNEDFANNVEFFLYQPDSLQKTNPGAHRWIGEHFGKAFKAKGAK